MEDQQLATTNPQIRRQMNANNSSTRNLPNEVLTSIFELVCSPSNAEKTPEDPRIVLASVCSHWHDVIWSISHLWPKLSITVRGRTIQKAASTLQMFADNHRAPGFTSLIFGPSVEDIEELWQPLEAFFSKETAPSIRHISLDGVTPDNMAVVKLVNERCCNIDRLNLSQGCSLSMLTMPEREIVIPTCWPTLTILKLKSIPVDICFDLLFGCPRLIRLLCDGLDEPTNKLTQPPSHQAQMTIFPNLETLSLNTHHVRSKRPWVDTLLQFYRFPALARLDWHPDSCSHSPELFYSFLSALPQCCDTLGLTVPHPETCLSLHDSTPIHCAKNAILRVGNIKTLLLSSHYYPSLLSWVMGELQDPDFLPSLTRLRFSLGYNNHMSDMLTLYGVYEMFKSRKKTGVKSFELRVYAWEFDIEDWKDERVKLARLMDDGTFNAEFFHNEVKLNI